MKALLLGVLISGCGAASVSSSTVVDTDGDGLTDDHDRCPSVSGDVLLLGCADSDGDAIADPDDECPSEAEDVDGLEDEDGCLEAGADNDGDGVLDEHDQCPRRPEDIDDFEDTDGCPDFDNDEDGVVDAHDDCPVEAEDKDNHQDQDGCPELDNDQDGFPDSEDDCPNVPQGEQGVPGRRGCSAYHAFVEAEQSGRLVILQKVSFATGSDRMLPRSDQLFAGVQRVIRRNPGLVVVLRIEGHAARGERGALPLSLQRAQSIARALVEAGIAPERLRVVGCGAALPIADNSTRGGRAENRRVEFHIVEPVFTGGERRTPPGTCEHLPQHLWITP